jgi:hypothetical protein
LTHEPLNLADVSVEIPIYLSQLLGQSLGQCFGQL